MYTSILVVFSCLSGWTMGEILPVPNNYVLPGRIRSFSAPIGGDYYSDLGRGYFGIGSVLGGGYHRPGPIYGQVAINRPVLSRPLPLAQTRHAPLPVPRPEYHHSQHVSGPEAGASIVNQDQDISYDGSFHYNYETDNGISASAVGTLNNPGTEVESQAMEGSFSYTSPEGLPITVRWYADETGFHAEGDHLPKQPIVPSGPEGHVISTGPAAVRPPLIRPVPVVH